MKKLKPLSNKWSKRKLCYFETPRMWISPKSRDFYFCGTFHFCPWNLYLLRGPGESDRPHCGHFVLQAAVVYSRPRRQTETFCSSDTKGQKAKALVLCTFIPEPSCHCDSLCPHCVPLHLCTALLRERHQLSAFPQEPQPLGWLVASVTITQSGDDVREREHRVCKGSRQVYRVYWGMTLFPQGTGSSFWANYTLPTIPPTTCQRYMLSWPYR